MFYYMDLSYFKIYMIGDDMNNRAFTLIELISLIVILLTIFLFAFPHFTNMFKENSVYFLEYLF